MKIDDFLSRLKGVQASGDRKWVACCPAHEDDSPSLGIALGADDRILVNCYAGCSFDEIVSAMGLKKSDLMPDNGKATPPKKKAKKAVAAPKDVRPSFAPKKDYGTLVESYDYQDEAGTVIFRVDRRKLKNGKKTFIQKHADPNSPYGWSYGVSSAGVNKIPFRLPRIVAAAKSGKNVVVLEGEKDVLAIEKRLGVVATCNPGGAGKWLAGWGKYFIGCKGVLIVADKDPMTKIDKKTGEEKLFAVGQRHACDIEAKLRADGFTGQIRKVCLPDVAGKGVKDFSDWVEAMDTAGNKVDKSAFQTAIAQFGEWPQEWAFDGADLDDLSRAQKNARVSASSSPEKERVQADGRGAMGEAGRYGRPCPRAPFKERGFYQVDFQIDPGKIGRFNVGRSALQFEGWSRSENPENYGDFVQMADYSEMATPPSRMVGMAIGCLSAFDRTFKLSNPQRTELACILAVAWLRSRGKFFADIDNPNYSTSLYFDSEAGILYNIHSDEFLSYLATAVNISRENKIFKFLIALIEDMVMTESETPRVRPSKEWDRRGNVIYISNGDSRIYKVSANKIENVSNGTDGVVFLRGSTLMPFELHDGPGADPFADSMLFKYAALERDTDVMNCRLWTLNLFACHDNKPILLVNGPRGSGKTFLLQGIKQFLGMRENGELDFTANKMDHSDKGSDNFWIIIDKGRFEIFDNFDYKIKWADNDLQTASTNGVHKTRELYKTNIIVTQYARASVALTSNNAVFAAEGGGLPDRIIKIGTIGRPKVSKGPGELLADNLKRRGEYMTWILRTLAAALADEKPVDANINRRHPEFAEFSVRCGRAMKCENEVVRALSIAETEKAALPLMNDIVAKEILAVLLSRKVPGNVSFTAGEMSDMILARMDVDSVDDKTRTIFGSRRVGKVFQRFGDDFRTLFDYNSRILEGKTRYDFTGLTARGQAVHATLCGGLVGFEGQKPKSPYSNEGAGGFPETTPLYPPYPPNTRARGHDNSLLREEEGIRDKEPTELTEGDDLVF
jgi:hypothetical protein